MRTGLMCALMCAVSATVAAQDGLRSASLPERGPRPTIAVERDVFLVPPDFYRTRPDPDPHRLFFPHFLSLPPGVPGWPYAAPVWQYPLSPYPLPPYVEEPVPGPRLDRERDPLEAMSATVAPPTMPTPPMVPGPPKTFYVIPGCYAGDKPPAPEWLRPGCDRANMRIIPPE
jgi:hypothetical protein